MVFPSKLRARKSKLFSKLNSALDSNNITLDSALDSALDFALDSALDSALSVDSPLLLIGSSLELREVLLLLFLPLVRRLPFFRAIISYPVVDCGTYQEFTTDLSLNY